MKLRILKYIEQQEKNIDFLRHRMALQAEGEVTGLKYYPIDVEMIELKIEAAKKRLKGLPSDQIQGNSE